MSTTTALRILVVDDDASTRSAMASLLRDDGHTVDLARDGLTALALAAAHAPNIVLTDLMMPGMDGITLLLRLHERAPELPVIVVTAAWDLVAAVRAVTAGADDYIAKPVDINALTLMIQRAVARSSRRARASEAAALALAVR